MNRHFLDAKSSRTGSGRLSGRGRHRRGAASLDYVLLLGVILPLVTFLMTVAPQIIRLAYEMVRIVVAWPWM